MNIFLKKHSIILLDRDGVINQDSEHYIRSVDEWNPIPGSLEAIAKLYQSHHQVFVVSNQSGIERGYYSQEILEAMHQKMRHLLHECGGDLTGIYYCPHLPEKNCECRKPKTGLITLIEKQHQISCEQAIFVGDRNSDIQMALAAKCQPVLVKTGKGSKTLEDHPELETICSVFENLNAFVDYYLRFAV